MEVLILGAIAIGLWFAIRHMKRNGIGCGGNCEGCGCDCRHRKG